MTFDTAPLHKLWTLAVGTDGYNKTDWKELERRLHSLAAESNHLRSALRTANERLRRAGLVEVDLTEVKP